jgi:putative Holliday junction resolvase
MLDERLTTVAAHRQLFDADLTGRSHRPFVDQQSAVLILQMALDRNRK